MTAVVFLEEAEDEFLEAIRYYTEHSRALGVDFVTEVQRAVDFAIQLPQTAPLVRPDVHKKTRKPRQVDGQIHRSSGTAPLLRKVLGL